MQPTYTLMMKDTGVHMKGGVITERDTDFCTVRTRVPAGNLTREQLRGLAEITHKFGNGSVHVTTRQTVEIPHVDPARLEQLARELASNNTPVGSERDEIVNVVCCPGNERCKYANIDTVSLAREIDARLFGRDMPVKIRISISGCPNACTSPMLNEIGIIGIQEPIRTAGLCTGCGTCMEYCREDAIRIRNGISVLDTERCMKCGNCLVSCPFGTLKTRGRQYLVTVGGRRGRHPKLGRHLAVIDNDAAVIETVEKIVQWVYRRAWSGRLLSDQLDDLRFDAFQSEILAGLNRETGDPAGAT